MHDTGELVERPLNFVCLATHFRRNARKCRRETHPKSNADHAFLLEAASYAPKSRQL